MTTPANPYELKKQARESFDKIIEDITRAAYARGFLQGVHVMKQQPEKPKGKCPHCRSDSLSWDGDPISCGCRASKCNACGNYSVSASFACEYAGLDCKPPSASEELKRSALRKS